MIFFITTSCGFGPSQPTPEKQGPTKIPDIGASNEFNEDVRPLLQANCALSGCHSGGVGFTLNSNDFLNSNAPKRIINGSMPPSYSPKYGQWGREEKKIVLDWYDDNM